MHPFGGSPRCPRCEKVVYAAEQAMGPGRKLYHKPCLSCMTCKKRLDSVSLVEHDEEPYCKQCHVKQFGTKTLAQANLPNREEVLGLSPPTSPRKFDSYIPPSSPTRTPTSPTRRHMTGGSIDRTVPQSTYTPILRPNMNISSPGLNSGSASDGNPEEEEEDVVPSMANTNTGRGTNGLPRTVPLINSSPRTLSHATGGRSGAKSVDWSAGNRYPATVGRSNSHVTASGQILPPLMSTATGTRYGVALTGGGPSSSPGKQWGGATPSCARCGKSVYFAEQVKAIGKLWHKACLRCSECGTTLDSGRLSERDGSPFCNRCYGKLHGPQGSGYALLGKAGG